MLPLARGNGVLHRWQVVSPGGLATPHAGLTHRFGAPSVSCTAVSLCKRKPQSMQEMAPGNRGDLHAGHSVGVDGAAGRDPDGAGGRGGVDAGPGVARTEPAAAPTGSLAGAGWPPTTNMRLHSGQRSCLPAALSGTWTPL